MTLSTQLNWDSIAPTPLARLRAIRDYANRVFDDEAHAATWLGRANRAVAQGLCAVGAACQDAEGFREAIGELARLERIAADEADRRGVPVPAAGEAPCRPPCGPVLLSATASRPAITADFRPTSRRARRALGANGRSGLYHCPRAGLECRPRPARVGPRQAGSTPTTIKRGAIP